MENLLFEIEIFSNIINVNVWMEEHVLLFSFKFQLSIIFIALPFLHFF